MGILICGLNGVGKSTIGRMLAERLSWRFIDNEDLFFPKDDLNYLFSHPRKREEVITLLEEAVTKDKRYVFTAVRGDYGSVFLATIEKAVLIEVPRELRLQRVYDRSFARFGERMLAGGDLFERESAFLEQVRSRPEDHVTSWLNDTGISVIRVDGTLPPEENVDSLIKRLGSR
ncbi:MAG: AAA family ATPase [Clostridia bacterium]|nr:AAA family ATPase [Clostridia bacterium]